MLTILGTRWQAIQLLKIDFIRKQYFHFTANVLLKNPNDPVEMRPNYSEKAHEKDSRDSDT